MSTNISKISEFIEAGNNLLELHKESVRISASHGIADLTSSVDKMLFTEWKYNVEDYIENTYGDKSKYLKRFEENVINAKLQDVKIGIGILKILEKNNTILEDIPGLPNTDTFEKLENILQNLYKMINKLKLRRDNREPLLMNDEYDIQYLLSSLLMIAYEDVRVEESMPSSVKSSNRIDIFLPEINAAIETKYLKDSKNEKKLIAEIKEDIISYQKHPKIKKLYFYIFDPYKNIINPKSYINDLNGKHNDLEVIIIIDN